MTWPDNNVIAAACSALGGALSVWLAGRVKRVISRDESLLRGYDQFTGRLAARVEALEHDLADQRRLLDESDAQRRRCEVECEALRRRVDELERRAVLPRGGKEPDIRGV